VLAHPIARQVQVRWKSGSEEGHITLEGETVFLSPHCSRLTQTSNMGLPRHATKAVQDWWKSGRKEGPFTLQAERVYCPYVASHFRVVTQTSHMALPHNAPQPFHVWSKSGNNKGTSLFRPKRFFAHILPRIEAGWFKHHNSKPFTFPDNQGKLSRSRAVTEVTLLLKRKQFLVHISPPIAAE
jgi:hypothetical protein